MLKQFNRQRGIFFHDCRKHINIETGIGSLLHKFRDCVRQRRQFDRRRKQIRFNRRNRNDTQCLPIKLCRDRS